MHTPATDEQTLGRAAKQVAEHASTLARLELELAAMELKAKVAALGIGAVLGVGALFFVFYAIGFAFATIAAALATFMPTWLALLLVTVLIIVGAGLLALLAVRSFRRGAPPVPEQAIEEARLTTAALKNDGD
jgi:Putative Actinobacterial Holin-X, holin superfamily III